MSLLHTVSYTDTQRVRPQPSPQPPREGEEGEKGDVGQLEEQRETRPQGIGTCDQPTSQGSINESGIESSPATSSGVLYTIWGNDSCPAVDGTELVYSGRVAGSANGTNYVCMPEDPDYYHDNIHGLLSMNSVEFYNHASLEHDCYATCAMCYIPTRSTILMIPAKLRCPKKWTTEYEGYMMIDSSYHSQHVCVDKSLKCIEMTTIRKEKYEFYPVYVDCNNDGFTCPSYSSHKALTCVLCSR